MSDHPTDFVGNVHEAISMSIKEKLPDATVESSGSGGHYSIAVVSTAFAGKSLLEQQRTVMSAIKHLLAGAQPPIHAVDSLITNTPS
ncbi:MAG TPA: BolA/IbaG family iron-sulfur metabolism protein [Kofleriaceae bacterium]